MKTKLLACTLVLGLLGAISCSKKEIKAGKFGAVSQSTMMLAASPPASYACFTISNVFSGKVMEVRGDSTLLHPQSSIKNVQQNANASTGTATAQNQKWYLIQQGTGAITSTTPFKIMNVASGMFLEAPNGTSGTQLWVNHVNSFPSQIWNIQLVTGQAYYVIKNSNGLVLTDNASSTANGAPITEETAASNTNRYWNLTSITNEAYRDDAVVTFFHRGNVANTTVAWDQGNSIPLTNGANNGKILWITQDAYASSQLQANGSLACQFFSYHNSAMLQPSITNWTSSSTPNITTTSNASTGVSLLEIVKSPGNHNSTYSWPGAGVEVGSNVLLNTYESANGSTPANQVLYSIAESTSSITWGAATRLTPNGMSGQTKMLFSVGMVKKPAGDTVYVWGAQSTFFNANAITLARFPASNPSSWSYWRGNSWASTPDTTSLTGAITVGSGTSTQANVAVSYVNGKYVMLQLDLGYFCDPNPHGIYISTATNPAGPFTTPKLVYVIQDWYNGHLAKYYTPALHGEFVNGRNELMITYSLNYNGQGGSCSTNTCFGGNQDPNFYQIKGVRIPYSLIGL
jgi:hypothetical protein